MTKPKDKRKWSTRAYRHWLEHGGSCTLNHAIALTAPPDTTEDERREQVGVILAEAQALHEAIIDALTSTTKSQQE